MITGVINQLITRGHHIVVVVHVFMAGRSAATQGVEFGIADPDLALH